MEIGSHAEPLSVGSQAVKLAQVGPGDPVLVYGVGPIGLYAIMALKLAGVGPIVAAGPVGRAAAGGRRRGRGRGHRHPGDLGRRVREAVGHAVRGRARVLGRAGRVQRGARGHRAGRHRRRGRADPRGGLGAAVPADQRRALHVVGSCAFSDETYRESVAHLAAGRVPVERLVSERVSLDDTPDALRRLQTPGSLVRIISRPCLISG